MTNITILKNHIFNLDLNKLRIGHTLIVSRIPLPFLSSQDFNIEREKSDSSGYKSSDLVDPRVYHEDGIRLCWNISITSIGQYFNIPLCIHNNMVQVQQIIIKYIIKKVHYYYC